MPRNLFLEFDRISIINLAERRDRRRQVTRELAAAGVEVDGHHVRFFEAIRPDGPGAFPSTGARGCFHSHLQVLRQARAEGVERLLVLEDDVMFTTALRDAKRLAFALRDDDWHLAYPGHLLPPLSGPLRWEQTDAPLMTAHCYAVAGHALPTVIRFLEDCLGRPAGHPAGGPMHYDGALTTLRAQQPNLVTLVASRSLARQRSSRSDIMGPSWLDHLRVPGLAAGARWLRNGWRRLAEPN